MADRERRGQPAEVSPQHEHLLAAHGGHLLTHKPGSSPDMINIPMGVWEPGESLVRSSHAKRPACLFRRASRAAWSMNDGTLAGRCGSAPGTLCRAWRDAGGELG